MEFSSRQIRAFLLAAEYGSFTRAAERLLLTPSAVSVLIRELEVQLGFRLFDRTTRHVALTPDGLQLRAVARRTLEELDAAMSRIAVAHAANQSLSIGAPPVITADVLPQAIKEFQDQQPGVRVHVFDADLTTVRQRVEAGKLDMGLGFYPRVSRVFARPFFRFALVVIRPESALGVPGAAISWSALRREKLIALPAASPLQQVIDMHLARAGVVSRPRFVLNSLETQIAMVSAGHGVAVVPSLALPTCRKRGVLVDRLTNPVVTVEYHVIVQRGKQLAAAAEDFAGFLQRYIARWTGAAGIVAGGEGQ
ncbi:MAG TPA: LysR family transcriptional regulator [Vicinamibacterales bacterium]|nr:LysR family transcriptional regulator [Vicinamibacterales bacterium]